MLLGWGKTEFLWSWNTPGEFVLARGFLWFLCFCVLILFSGWVYVRFIDLGVLRYDVL